MIPELTKQKIQAHLRRRNRFIWTDSAIEVVLGHLEALKEGRAGPKDYVIPGLLTYEDYFYQLNLSKFL